MGRPTQPRAEKELDRILKLDEAKSQIELVRAAFEPFKSYAGKKHFDNWLRDIQFFREHDGKIKLSGKLRHLSKEENLFFDRLDFFKAYVSRQLNNPITSFPITILKRVLFEELDQHKYMGVSHEILDENEGYLNPHARIYMEPGATTDDVKEYLTIYGDEIRQELNKYLPQNNHLRSSLRSTAVEERNKFIADLKMKGVSAKEIQIQVSQQGYKKISINNIAKIKRALG